MSTSLIPNAFWFRLCVPCPRIDGLPRSKGRLLDLPETCLVPTTSQLDDQEPWAQVRTAWNPSGLAIAVEVSGKTGPIVYDPDRPFACDGVQVWVDTRDTRDIHRASRFCHRFQAILIPYGAGSTLGVDLSRRPIARALAEPPSCRPGALAAHAERLPGGWRLEMFLRAEALHGFDPDTNRRLGFYYQVTDPDRDDHYLGVGREFPIGEDPSLWATLELRDE